MIGCSQISPGCNNCYAERMAGRLANIPSQTNNYGRVVRANPWSNTREGYIGEWNEKTHMVESALEKPLHWKKPRTIFVCSMGDLFHNSVPAEWIDNVFDIIQKCPQHTFLILTKRPARMWRYYLSRGIEKPFVNVWLGVTAENQEQADRRIPVLLSIPAAKHFVSVEPMLGPVDLKKINYDPPGMRVVGPPQFHVINALTGYQFTLDHKLNGAGTKQFPSIDWLICGGESGPKARPMHPDWVRSLRDQCQEAGVPFFFKQWGEWSDSIPPSHLNRLVKVPHGDYSVMMARVGKKKAGHLLDGKEWRERP